MSNIVDSMNSTWEMLSSQSLAFERSLEPLRRKQTGSYYTALELAYYMVKEMVESLGENELSRLPQKKFLEPCVGTGNFVFAYLRICRELGFSKMDYKAILDNIYVCDINEDAVSVYYNNLKIVADEWFGIKLADDYFSSHVGSGLLFNIDEKNIRYIPITEVFSKEIVSSGFDFIATNPPYKNLKAERSHYISDEQKAKDKSIYSAITELAAKHFSYSISGTLNMYKLFVEEIVERYSSPTGVCSLLIPSSILSDKSCVKLRTRILENCSIKSIRNFSESSRYVDAAQALCAVLLHKGEHTQNIKIDGSFDGDISNGTITSLEDIIDESTGNAIFVLSENENRIRKKMREHPTIRDISYIINMRGELDLTLNKHSITMHETAYPLYRGRHINYYKIVELETKEYVKGDFVDVTAKRPFIFSSRIICQQIVNMAKKRRIAFAPVPTSSVLGNSCNFVTVEENTDGVDIYFVLGVLNSTLIDWYFRLTSSNNHINNYEIDSFPIPISFAKKNEISDLVQRYLTESDDLLLPKIDSLVYEAYGLTNASKHMSTLNSEVSEALLTDGSVFSGEKAIHELFCCDLKLIVPDVTETVCLDILHGKISVNEVCFEKLPEATKFEKQVLIALQDKYRSLYKGKILNHITFKLSDLDLEMIRPIPQGGNWKNIPFETVQKSKRLVRITKTGGRTTLYGRIDYNKPSYTITTYFNRPGNGSYVHPTRDRVLSVREAARFQSFPDDYLFCGNKTELLKQVGNAVPVLMAYCIGKSIREKTGCCTSVDLFSGAGGMTYGLKLAGINTAIANDFAESACVTMKVNSPEIPVIQGDITDEYTKRKIIEAGVLARADIICGGPPCQGFSLAGFRMKDDPRNELFRHFVDIVSGVNPKVIVFENVEGILSYQHGETYRNIIELFSELGYHTEGRKLLSNHYGVPQRRKRVIILCTRKDLAIMPSEIYPEIITPNSDSQTTAYETIFDLEQVECSVNASYTSPYTSPILQYLKRKITPAKYIEMIADFRGVLDVVGAASELYENEEDELKADTKFSCEQLSLF
jgi:DNA-cytosine methyltransferase